MHGRELIKISIQLVLIILLFLIAASCVSFNIFDPPAKYASPVNDPPSNWLSLPGAYASFYLLYYIGPGVFMLLGSLIVIIGADMFGKPIGQLPFRIIGTLLLCISISTIVGSSDALNFAENAIPIGRAGILGTFMSSWLLSSIGQLGRFSMILTAGIIGLIFLADTAVLSLLRLIWRFVASMFIATGKASKKKNKPAKTKIAPKPTLFDNLREKRLARAEEKQAAKEEKLFLKEQAKAEKAEKAEKKLEKKAKTKDIQLETTPKKEFEISRDNRVLEPVQLHPDQPSDYIEVIPDPERTEVIEVSSKPEIFKAPKPSAPSIDKSAKQEAVAAQDPQPKPRQMNVNKNNHDSTPDYKQYILPPIDLLDEPEKNFADKLENMVREKAQRLQETLDSFKIEATVINAEPGPTITLYEVELSAGMRVNKISNLSDDIARTLAVQVVRVVSPLPGKDTIGIEVPNSERETVRLMDLIKRAGKVPMKMSVPIFLGKDSSGSVLVADLAEMPHGLIAGTTGSGKSVCINTIIISILLTRKPNEVKLILVDPKQIEMNMYEGLPHLMCPIVSDMNQTSKILEWAVGKMEERYAIFNEVKIKNIAEYNQLGEEEVFRRLGAETPEEQLRIPKKMPYLVIIVDELSDLMMTNGKEVEEHIVRLTQKSRAAGIHVILATQRPQASVVTGLIKSNLPARISFKVASRMDSRIILDKVGAETLLGKGDMLYLHPKTNELIRAQGAYLSNDEIDKVVSHIRDMAQPDYSKELVQMNTISTDGLEKDEFFDEAVRIVLETKRGSVSLIQRRLAIGYGRASRIVEMMADCGILGDHKNAQAREVMITPEEWERIKDGEELSDIRNEPFTDNDALFDDANEDEYLDDFEEEEINEDEQY